jgi:hypothetical protein
MSTKKRWKKDIYKENKTKRDEIEAANKQSDMAKANVWKNKHTDIDYSEYENVISIVKLIQFNLIYKPSCEKSEQDAEVIQLSDYRRAS